MTLFSVSARWILAVLAVCLAGCSFPDDRDETKDAHYLTGKSRQQGMNYKGAAEAFEKALEVNPQSSAAHLELGLLHAEKLNESATSEEERGRNFAVAIYHLDKFIQLNPKSSWVARVRGQIEGCKYELAKTAPFTLLPNTVQAELERLNATNTVLRQQVEQLKLQMAQQAYFFSNRLALVQNQGAATPISPAYLSSITVPTRTNSTSIETPAVIKPRQQAMGRQTARQPAPLSFKPATTSSRPVTVALSRTHSVRSGETLAAIARAHGISLGSLLAVNPGVDARKLRVGQTINLPSPRS